MDEELEALRRRKLQEMVARMQRTEAKGGAGGTPDGKPVELTKANFDAVIASRPLVLVDFWAPWCGPCRMVAPAVEALARDYAGRVTFGKLNTDDEPEIAMRFGIMSIPTLMIFKGGKPVDQIIGAVPRAHIEAALKRHL